MEVNLNIEYYWTADSGIETPEKHKEALKEDAEERISKIIQEGYIEGELVTTVRFGKDIVPEEDEKEGISYSGWWKMKREQK